MLALLDHTISYDPALPAGELLARVPAGWCVYLLADEAGRAVQLLCVRNLRASLKRRLGEPAPNEGAPAGRRIDYRALVRRISWSRVDSAFEQDVLYLEAARALFPATYAGVLGFRPASFIHVDPTATHPRFARVDDLTRRGDGSRHFGPLPERNAAAKLAHHIEELFDLCRDPAALVASPAGPCQWRQMGKCVGPCDGNVSLDAYRALVAHAADVLGDVGRAVENQTLRMRQAAAATEFEAAGRIKSYVESLAKLREGANRHVRPLERFRFLAVMPGPRTKSAKLFAITPGRIDPLACLLALPDRRATEELARVALQALEGPHPGHLDAAGFERISLVSHHLFPTRKTPGIFLPADELTERSFASALREVSKGGPVPETDDEGEVRGLGAV